MKKLNTTFTCLIILIIIVSCTSSVNPVAEGLSAAEYFQKAYEAMDNKDYSLAIRYYEAFQEKFPDDTVRNLWAEYEIAFVYYKMGNYPKATGLFDNLLALYAEKKDETWPDAPKILAEEVKKKMAE